MLQLEEIKEKNKTNLEVNDRAINKYKIEHEKLCEQIERNKEKEEKRIEELQKENDKLKEVISEKEKEIDRLIWRQNLPENPNEVAGWVEESFSGKMIFHDKATDLMKKLKRDEVDMDDICLALEYLATDYRDSLLGSINNDELLKIASAKYGRPINVSPSGNNLIEMYPKEYKIKYGMGIKGKPTEKPLNLHLKIGNTSENLLRIYFLYDKENKLIVVGSLPRHLSTTKFG